MIELRYLEPLEVPGAKLMLISWDLISAIAWSKSVSMQALVAVIYTYGASYVPCMLSAIYKNFLSFKSAT